MKITARQLRRIIREEVNRSLLREDNHNLGDEDEQGDGGRGGDDDADSEFTIEFTGANGKTGNRGWGYGPSHSVEGDLGWGGDAETILGHMEVKYGKKGEFLAHAPWIEVMPDGGIIDSRSSRWGQGERYKTPLKNFKVVWRQ